jgi:hypothetical protein
MAVVGYPRIGATGKGMSVDDVIAGGDAILGICGPGGWRDVVGGTSVPAVDDTVRTIQGTERIAAGDRRRNYTGTHARRRKGLGAGRGSR